MKPLLIIALLAGQAIAQQSDPLPPPKRSSTHEFELRSASEDFTLDQLLDTEDDLTSTELFQTRLVDPGWWQAMVASSHRKACNPVSLSLENLLVRTLQHSKQVKVFSELPLIRETSIVEADSAFDWSAFLDSRWDDTSEPVGNSLTAGPGINRFRDHNLSFSAGARKRTYSGGQFEIAQRFGLQNNNSQFFTPNDQGTSRIVLSYTQPLLRGRGETYNRSLVCLASIDQQIANDEFMRQLQSHLLEVTRSYWATYLERGALLQKMNSYRRARETVSRLELRRNIDATVSQIQSAQAALKTRKAELARAIAAVKNAESRMRSLVNDPALADFENTELIPADAPSFQTFPVDMQASIGEAMRNRPEVSQSIKQIKAAGIRQNMTRHELMPVLNLVTETYVAGLDGDHNIGGAWRNQFNQGEPGYSIGLQFEVPIHNRAARARHTRRRHELRQLQNQYETTLESISLEVQVAVREISTSQRELFAKEDAMLARKEQLEYLQERWERLPGEDVSASLALENLLSAQERLAASEFDYLQSQMTYNLSLMNLKRATGTLLQHESVSIARSCQNGLPTQTAQKPEIDRLNLQ